MLDHLFLNNLAKFLLLILLNMGYDIYLLKFLYHLGLLFLGVLYLTLYFLGDLFIYEILIILIIIIN